MKILVVGPNSWLRSGLGPLLRDQPGVKVVAAAGNCRKVIQLALDYHPTIVVLDDSEPGLDGIAATRKICAACPEARVVLLSNHSTAERVCEALRAGALGYVLMKESAASDMVAAVRSVAQGISYLDQELTDILPDSLPSLDRRVAV